MDGFQEKKENGNEFEFLVECSVGAASKAERCNGTACLWRFWEMDKTMRSECRTEDFAEHFVLILQTDFQQIETTNVILGNPADQSLTDRSHVIRGIDLWCDLNNCNNGEATQKLTEAAHKHYAFWSLFQNPSTLTKRITESFDANTTFSNETNASNDSNSISSSTDDLVDGLDPLDPAAQGEMNGSSYIPFSRFLLSLTTSFVLGKRFLFL